MKIESVERQKRDYLFSDIEDAILKMICYGASWVGGILVPNVEGALSTSQGVFFLFFVSLGIEFILPAVREKKTKYFTWWSISFILILSVSILISFGAMYSSLTPYLTPWLFRLSCIAMIFLLIDLIRHLHSLAKNSQENYEAQILSQYQQSVVSSYAQNGAEGFLTGGNKNG